MGTVRSYVRLTTDELQHALGDPEWAAERLMRSWVNNIGLEPEKARYLDVDKSWRGIEFTLAGAGLTATELNGTTELYIPDPDTLGPPTYLSPAEVAVIAGLLSGVEMRDLVDAVDPDAARAAQLYKVDAWTDRDRDYVVENAELLQRFLIAAAAAGDAVVTFRS